MPAWELPNRSGMQTLNSPGKHFRTRLSAFESRRSSWRGLNVTRVTSSKFPNPRRLTPYIPLDVGTATLNTPVIVDGREALPRGTLFAGHLTNATHSGRFKGRAVSGLTLDSFTLDNET